MSNFGSTSDRCEVCLFGNWMPATLTALLDTPDTYMASIKLPDIPNEVRQQISANTGRVFPPDETIDVLIMMVWENEVRGDVPT